MIWDFFLFFLGAGLATAVCWWLWRGSPTEKAALKAKIQRLEDDLSSRFKSS